MAFILRGAARVLSNASRQVQGRALSFHSHHFHVNHHHQRLHHLHNNLSKVQNCRSICNIHNNLLQAETPSVTATMSKHEEDHVLGGEGRQIPTGRHDARPLSAQFKTKSQFLIYFHNQLSKGEVITTTQAFIMVKACGQHMVGETCSSRNELLTYVWEELEMNGVPLETGMWNTLLSVYVENKFDFDPLAFLKDMWQKSNSEPNKSTFSLLIQSYAVKGDPVGAMKIVEFMMENGERMTEHIYGCLVHVFAKSANMDGVNNVLESMRKNNIQANHTTYGHLINAHAERGDVESINNTIQQMVENNIYPTTVIYINLLDHLSISGHTDLIEKVWTEIGDVEYLSKNIIPLIQRCVTRGDYEAAFILLKNSVLMRSKHEGNYYKFLERRLFQMLRLARKDINEYVNVSLLLENHLDQDEFSRIRNLIEFLVTKNENDAAFKLLESLLCENKPVTVRMFHPILESYAEKKCVNEIVRVYEFMIDKNIPLDFYCFKLVIPSLGEPTSDEYQLYLELVKKNDKIVLPFRFLSEILKSDDNITLSELTNAICSAPSKDLFHFLKEIKSKLMSDFNADNAIEVVSLLHKRGLKDVTILIEEIMTHVLNSEENHAEEALTFMKGVIKKDIPIKSTSYTKLLKILYKNNMADQFFMFVRLLKVNGIDPDVHQYYQMLKMAAKVGNSMAAQFCFEKVLGSEDYPHDKGQLYEYLITAYSKDTESASLHTFLPTHIRGRDSENSTKVVDLYDEMITKRYNPSDETITRVINSYLLVQDIEGAKKALEEHGTVRPYFMKMINNSFMRAYVAKKEFTKAEELFDQVKAESTVTQFHYNEMMRTCEYTGDIKRVEELYEEMLEKGFVATVFSHLPRIRTYLTANKPKRCVSIIEENVGKKPMYLGIYFNVLQRLVATGNVKNVVKVIELIKEHHTDKVPQQRLDDAMLLVNIKAGKLEDASALLPPQHDDDSESVHVVHKAAKHACAKGDVNYIKNVMDFLKMNNLHYQFLDIDYLKALNKNNDIDEIQHFYNERMTEGVTFDGECMAILESIIKHQGVKSFIKV